MSARCSRFPINADEVPALPGCYSQGETIDELMANVREAVAGVLEVMREQGKQPETNIKILDVVV